jgi:circadian clock protein KaiC
MIRHAIKTDSQRRGYIYRAIDFPSMDIIEVDAPEVSPVKVLRLSTGIGGLDRATGGGVPTGSALLVAGAPGTGKTTMVLQMLMSCAASGVRCAYLAPFTEPIEGLMAAVSSFKFMDREVFTTHVEFFDLADAIYREKVDLETLGKSLGESGVKLVVLDSVTALRHRSDDMEYPSILRGFIIGARRAGATVVMTSEMDEKVIAGSPESTFSDSMIILQRTGSGMQKFRYLTILKMRSTKHTLNTLRYEITTEGMEVYPYLNSN